MSNDPYSKSWSKEELSNLPQTTQVFEETNLVIDQHDWQQQGYIITDVCSLQRVDCQHVGIPIPSGKLLIKRGGHYDLIDEILRV